LSHGITKLCTFGEVVACERSLTHTGQCIMCTATVLKLYNWWHQSLCTYLSIVKYCVRWAFRSIVQIMINYFFVFSFLLNNTLFVLSALQPLFDTSDKLWKNWQVGYLQNKCKTGLNSLSRIVWSLSKHRGRECTKHFLSKHQYYKWNYY